MNFIYPEFDVVEYKWKGFLHRGLLISAFLQGPINFNPKGATDLKVHNKAALMHPS